MGGVDVNMKNEVGVFPKGIRGTGGGGGGGGQEKLYGPHCPTL